MANRSTHSLYSCPATLAAILILAASPPTIADTVPNQITIAEQAGVSSTLYPVQIGRPFVEGEIPHYPQAVVDGSEVETQADVKSRWDDGSVKHAVLSFLVPDLPAFATVDVEFRNQLSGNNSSGLTKSEMLSPIFDFDAVIELTGAGELSASAREMLEADAYTLWADGSVASTAIIADHSLQRAFDIGFDSYRSFRPIFHATFWPDIDKVRVRYIGEISNSEALQDQGYALELLLGDQSPETVYTHSTFTHTAMSRWTQEFWIGGEPTRISIDHNLRYLRETKLIPYYDVDRPISESAMQGAYDSWISKDRDLRDGGNWTKAMHTAGGRPDIGPYPTWTVRWLFTGDHRMQEKALGNADLAAAWPMHMREGLDSKDFDIEGTIPGLGKPISISDRPTFWITRLDWNNTDEQDRVVPVGPKSDGGWKPDKAHQPDPFSLQYMLTGDYWYLEELQFWAAWSAADGDGPATAKFWGRGPTGAEGGYGATQIRGQAWTFRSRARAAALSPDGTPERDYFTRLTEDAIAVWEGEREIYGTQFEGDPNWTWGRDTGGQRWDSGYSGHRGPPLLHHWDLGTTGKANGWTCCMSADRVQFAHEPWQFSMILSSLGHAKELGFPADALVSWLAENLIGQLTDPDYDPFLIGAYRIPIVRESDTEYFGIDRASPWADAFSGYEPWFDTISEFEQDLRYVDHSYALMAGCAASMITDEPGGDEAWQFIADEVHTADGLDDNPKWVLLPRPADDGADLLRVTFVDPPADVPRGTTVPLPVLGTNDSDEDMAFDEAIIEETGPEYRIRHVYRGPPITIPAHSSMAFTAYSVVPETAALGSYLAVLSVFREASQITTDSFITEVVEP